MSAQLELMRFQISSQIGGAELEQATLRKALAVATIEKSDANTEHNDIERELLFRLAAERTANCAMQTQVR
jgi:hypothetical protein